MKYCEKCGRTYDDKYQFCTKDGTPLKTKEVAPIQPPRGYTDERRTPPVTPPPGKRTPGGYDDGNNNKKTVAILATALAVVVVICAVVLIIFTMKNNEGGCGTAKETEPQTETTVQVTEAPTEEANNAEEQRYNNLLIRYNNAKLKATSRGVSVVNEERAAKEALDAYKGAIDANNESVLSSYGDNAETYVSKLESAANKAKKKKKSGTTPQPPKKPITNKTNYKVAPTGEIGDFYYDQFVSDEEDRYMATILGINEYYAQRGCRFDTPSLQKYFNHQKWYKNKGKNASKVTLTGLANRNVKQLYKDREYYKKFLDGASGKASDFTYEDYKRVAAKID